MYKDALRTGKAERGAFVFYDCLCLDEDRLVNWGHCGIALDDGKIIHAWDKVRTDDYLDIEKLTALSGDHPKYIGWVPVSRVLAEKDPDAPSETAGQERQIIRLSEHRELKETAADWYSSKWHVPKAAYLESIEASFTSVVPSWYLCMEGEKIIAGMGVIENDFHDRKDLTPNVCAVFTEPEYRCQGIAGKLLNFVCDDMKQHGISTLYLLTDHTGFYERYGWKFYCMVQGDGEEEMSRMYVKTTGEE